MPMDEDLVNDDVPFNLAFVESYYGDQSKLKASPSSSRSGPSIAEEHGDDLLYEGTATISWLIQMTILVISLNLRNLLCQWIKALLATLKNKSEYSVNPPQTVQQARSVS